MTTIECKLAMCISRLVKFELLLELTGFRLWRQYWRHFLGYILGGGHISLKNETFCPFLATIQALSRARAFLLG
jgi:hypothetical protein